MPFIDSESPELTRNPVPSGDVPVSQHAYDATALRILPRFGQGFRHGAVPRQLSLDDVLELLSSASQSLSCASSNVNSRRSPSHSSRKSH